MIFFHQAISLLRVFRLSSFLLVLHATIGGILHAGEATPDEALMPPGSSNDIDTGNGWEFPTADWVSLASQGVLGDAKRETCPLRACLFSRELLRASDYRIAMDRIKQRVWYRGFGHILSQGASSGARNSVDARTVGFSVGLERRLARTLTIGVGIGGNWTSTDRTPVAGESDVAAMFVSLYGRWSFRQLFFEGEVGYGYDDFRTKHDATGGWVNGRHDASQYHVRGYVGAWWEYGFSKMEPYFGIQHVGLYEPDYRESGESGIAYPAADDHKTTLLIGVRYSWRHTGQFALVTPMMQAGWCHELESSDLFSVGSFGDAPTVFRVRDSQLREDRFFVGAGITGSMRRRLDLYFRYVAEIASGYGSHTLLGGMNWNF